MAFSFTDTALDVTSLATKTQLAALAATVPSAETSLPSVESKDGAAGPDMTKFTAGKHSHPRLTSATIVTLDAGGLSTATFTRSFANEPSIDLTPIAPGGAQPVALQVESWVREVVSPTPSGAYVGCVVKGFRAAPTTLAAVTVATVSVAVGAQTVTPFSGPAAGVRVSVIALQNSAV